tara:strand:+ start:367 stop:564 length:198 start_codon:yes stop_codon:yes gene_type:complete
MQGPYTIRRQAGPDLDRAGTIYTYTLTGPSGAVIRLVESRSPIAPRDILKKQAQLNSVYLLNHAC